MSHPLQVSAVIPTFRRLDVLRRCLERLVAQEYPALEILVVDDSGGDGTPAIVAAEFPDVRVLENATRQGAAATKNRGAAAAGGELLWFLDSDTEAPDPGLLGRLVQALVDRPDAAAVGGERVRTADGRWLLVQKLLGRDGLATSVALEIADDQLLATDYLATSNCLVRACAFREVGGFDPEYGILSEDLELGYRLRQHGHAVLTGPHLALHHHAEAAGRTGDLYLKYRNGLRFAIKNLPAPELALVPLASLLGLLHPTRWGLVFDARPEALKYLPAPLRDTARRTPWRTVPEVARLTGSALVRAWVWNLSHLSETLAARRAGPPPGRGPGRAP